MEHVYQTSFLLPDQIKITDKVTSYITKIEDQGYKTGTILITDRKMFSGVIEITYEIFSFDNVKNDTISFTCTDIVFSK